MSYREQDIKHQTKDFFVLDVGAKGFEVYQTGITAATRVAIVGNGHNLGLPRAIQEADKRQKKVDAFRRQEGMRDYPLGGMSMRPTIPWSITKIIIEVREEFIAKGRALSAWHINDGLCDNFAREVLETLPGGATGAHGFTDVENLNFMHGSEDGDPSWDWQLLKSKWGMDAPELFTREELEHINFGHHVWITDGKLHYDAECPQGVSSFFELPIFKSYIEEALKEKDRLVSRHAA